jgi:cation transport regulator ChaB
MSIQKIIQESINGNPLEMKEILESELRDRIRLALEAKMSDEDEDDDEDDDSEEDKK